MNQYSWGRRLPAGTKTPRQIRHQTLVLIDEFIARNVGVVFLRTTASTFGPGRDSSVPNECMRMHVGENPVESFLNGERCTINAASPEALDTAAQVQPFAIARCLPKVSQPTDDHTHCDPTVNCETEWVERRFAPTVAQPSSRMLCI